MLRRLVSLHGSKTARTATTHSFCASSSKPNLTRHLRSWSSSSTAPRDLDFFRKQFPAFFKLVSVQTKSNAQILIDLQDYESRGQLERWEEIAQEKKGTAITLEALTAEDQTSDDSSSKNDEYSDSDDEDTDDDDDDTDNDDEADSGEHDDDAGYDSQATLTPREVVSQLDRFIIGQNDAKKAVAIALRNRWRRRQLPDDMRDEISPRNILMVGPTGCGKTEIARRLAKLADAPFLKIETTKFTEVGFHGRDVDTIIKDLVEVGIAMTKQRRRKRIKRRVAKAIERVILGKLVGKEASEADLETWRTHLREGALEETQIEIDVPAKPEMNVSAMSSQQSAIMLNLEQLQGRGRTQRSKMKIKDARPILEDQEAEKMLNMEDVTKEALRSVEQDGIVFLDEIDKIVTPSGRGNSSADASAEGVQRDLLPLIEGCSISTKYGNVNTDHILFVCSGAFHSVKPSDMMAELQGRLPIRVHLKGLTEEDLYRILTEPEYNLIRQQTSLLSTEDVEVEFDDSAMKELARVAFEANTNIENIGARRLQTVVEKLMEDISFEACDTDKSKKIAVTSELVTEKISPMLRRDDLSKFIL